MFEIRNRLVILGCGYLGAALARGALASGASVSSLTRNAERAPELRAMGVGNVVDADIAGDDWHAALSPADAAIIVCVSPSSPDPTGYRHSFVAGIESVRRWIEKNAASGGAPARDVLFTSATSVYPQTDGGWVAEHEAGEPSALGPAGAALRAGEDLVLSIPVGHARRAWALRLAGIYGPERHHLLDAVRAGQRVFPGRGDYWVNLIHREDAALAVRACVTGATPEGAREILNCADGAPVLKRNLLAGLAQLLGLDPRDIRCDDTAPSTRAPHRQPAGGGTPNRRITCEKLRALGWRPEFPSWQEGFGALLASVGK